MGRRRGHRGRGGRARTPHSRHGWGSGRASPPPKAAGLGARWQRWGGAALAQIPRMGGSGEVEIPPSSPSAPGWGCCCSPPSTFHPGKLRLGASPCPPLPPSHGKTPGAGSWWLLRPPRSPGRKRWAGNSHGLAAPARRGWQREKRDRGGTGHRRAEARGPRGAPSSSLSRSGCDQVPGGAPRVLALPPLAR